mmetsp:Transcript_22862/g.47418  ORF Transcript_22862/g.47418 Transcript_22862/m.47418 type:complete len:362 (-) Transcript_22862:116-1201(-)
MFPGAGGDAGNSSAGVMKLVVMLPVMLYARKLDSEDENIVRILRIAYGTVQAAVLLVVFLCMQKVATKEGDRTVVYTEKAKGFMDPPDGPKKYIKTTRGEMYTSKMTEFRNSTLMSIVMTTGLHYYKGMVMGLCMQCAMAPFNTYENKIVQWVLVGKENMGEKEEGELEKDDLIIEVGPDGSESVVGKGGDTSTKGKAKITNGGNDKGLATTSGSASSMTKQEFEELVLDTWDQASEADLKPLLRQLNKDTVKWTTDEQKWTPLMVLCGLSGAPGFEDGIRKCIELGADTKATDKDGWTPLHWTAFHGNATAAKVLCEVGGLGKDDITKTDNDGKTVETLAEEEGNKDVWFAIEKSMAIGK